MIFNTIDTASQFRDKFHSYGRGDQFSYNAFTALFEYYGEISEACGEPYKMDVVEICTHWGEYETMQEAADDYDIDEDIDRDDDEAILEWFHDNQNAVQVEGGGILVGR